MSNPQETLHWRIKQGGIVVCGGSGPKDRALIEMGRYAAQYAEEGPIERIETRTDKGRWKRHIPWPRRLTCCR
jgi:hypothetical protein